MITIRIQPLEDYIKKGVGFEVKPVDEHTVKVKVTRGDKWTAKDFDLTSFKDDDTANMAMGVCLEHMIDDALGIEL